MKIEPIYVTFEHAKLLKEKGFDERFKAAYSLDGTYLQSQNYGSPKSIQGHLGKLLNPDVIPTNKIIYAPEQWQVIEWLRIVHGIWIKIDLDETTNTDTTLKYHYECIKIETDFRWSKAKVFDTPQEAYSEAFDYTLNNLI